MKIVISELIWPIGIEILEQKGWSVVYDPEMGKNREWLVSEIKTADALIVRNQTKVDHDLLEKAEKLKVVGRLGVGLDNLDLNALRGHDIIVVYAKNANATSVAEYVISAMMTTHRSLERFSADVKQGRWDRKKNTGSELYGKTLGLIGIGEIGHRVATRATFLGLDVMGYDPFVAPYDFPIMESGIKLKSLEAVLGQSDYISLHVPLTKGTEHLINKNTLAQMKPSACLINSARGGIVNEEDLAQALKKGIISTAVIDVLSQEPPSKDHPLIGLENCTLTPHIAGLTEEAQIRTSKMVAVEVINELEGRRSLSRVR